MKIVSRSKGHSDLAATSSDDQTARMWDLRTCKSVRRMKLPINVNNEDDDVGSVRFNPDGLRVYVAVGAALHEYDLRNTSDVIVNTPSKSLVVGDTINEFDISSDGNCIIVPQDDGNISTIDASTFSVRKTLSHAKPNAKNEDFGGEAVSVAVWNPGQKVTGTEFVSAGYDMAVCRWGYRISDG